MEEQLVNREIKFNVPKKLTKAEFENTIKFFKENGAKYHGLIVIQDSIPAILDKCKS